MITINITPRQDRILGEYIQCTGCVVHDGVLLVDDGMVTSVLDEMCNVLACNALHSTLDAQALDKVAGRLEAWDSHGALVDSDIRHDVLTCEDCGKSIPAVEVASYRIESNMDPGYRGTPRCCDFCATAR